MTLNVVVTGATGFVGRPLCAALVARGHRVRAFVRPGCIPPGGQVDVVPLRDLDDAAALGAGCANADAVVHLAGRVHLLKDTASDPDAAYRHTNVTGTRQVLAAAVAGGVRQFVLLSSVKAIGDSSVEPWSEDQPPAPSDAYGRSKLEAERLARDVADRTGLRVSVLRLPLVYGPGATANVQRLMALVGRGWPLPFGAVHNRRSMIYVENAVAAILALLEAPAGADGVFFASDADDLSTPQLIRMIAHSLGRPARLVPLPLRLLRALGWVADRSPAWVRVSLGSSVINRLTASLAVTTRKLSAATGWRPTVSPEEGWRLTAEWYRATQGKT